MSLGMLYVVCTALVHRRRRRRRPTLCHSNKIMLMVFSLSSPSRFLFHVLYFSVCMVFFMKYNFLCVHKEVQNEKEEEGKKITQTYTICAIYILNTLMPMYISAF